MRIVRHPHPPTEMLVPFVRWVYGTPSPQHPAVRSGFFRLSVSLAEPCPRLTPVITSIWVGEWEWVPSKKTSFLQYFLLWRTIALFFCKRGPAFWSVIGLPASSRSVALDRAPKGSLQRF
jgi:hypothetical protein